MAANNARSATPRAALAPNNNGGKKVQNDVGHTTVGIRWWSRTQLLIYRFEAYVWQSGRDAQFSSICGRM